MNDSMLRPATVTYQREPWSDALRDEAMPLLLRHWEEIALDKEMVPLDPKWEMYSMMERSGMLTITTARLDGTLIGYVSHFVVPNLHYASLKIADNDLFWLAPEHRNSRIGITLLRESEKNAIAMGCNKITMKEKIDRPLGRLFEYLGYRTIERLHAKTLITKAPTHGD